MILKSFKGLFAGTTKKFVLLKSLVGYEKFDSYLVDIEGHIYSGKGGKFKRLSLIQEDFFLVSRSIPFSISEQKYISKSSLSELISLGNFKLVSVSIV